MVLEIDRRRPGPILGAEEELAQKRLHLFAWKTRGTPSRGMAEFFRRDMCNTHVPRVAGQMFASDPASGCFFHKCYEFVDRQRLA